MILNRSITLYVLISVFLTLIASQWTYSAQSKKKKKKVIYRSHTQVDLSGGTVEGKIRAPEVFYIFQRRRAVGHKAARTPSNFSHHRKETTFNMKKALGTSKR